MRENPKQIDGRELTPVDDGFIIRDAAKDRVHSLNHAAALVPTLRDGQNTAAGGIPLLLQRQLDLREPPDGAISALLAQVVGGGLVEAPAGPPDPT